MLIRLVLPLAAALAVARTSVAQRAPVAVALLEAARDAVEAVSSVSYEFEFEGTEALSHVPFLFGEARLERVNDLEDSRILVRTNLVPTQARETHPKRIAFASNGEVVTGHSDRTGFHYHGLVADGAMNLLPGLGENGLLKVYVEANPFEQELAAPYIQFIGVEEVFGVPCDIVEVRLEPEKGEGIRWYIGLEDQLPRGRAQYYDFVDPPSQVVTLVKELRTGETHDPGIFKLDPRPDLERYDFAMPLAGGDQAPPWSLRLADGGDLESTQLEENVVVLAFVEPGSDDAVAFVDSMKGVRNTFAGRPVRFVVVSIWNDDEQAVAALAERLGSRIPLALNGERVMRSYGVGAAQSIVVLDPQLAFQKLLLVYDDDKRQSLENIINALLESDG
ncbi:MAG: peroxiredoxin family protein [Phycisphaerales bacterium]